MFGGPNKSELRWWFKIPVPATIADIESHTNMRDGTEYPIRRSLERAIIAGWVKKKEDPNTRAKDTYWPSTSFLAETIAEEVKYLKLLKSQQRAVAKIKSI